MKETFGQRFVRLRKEKGFTQEDIANKINISAQAVSKWENDISLPDIAILGDLADIFGISIDELLGRNVEQKVELLDDNSKKNINKMALKIKVISDEGDKVNINLPVALVKACIESGANFVDLGGNKTLKDIDFKQIYTLIEQGVVGELITIESSDGDKVIVVVE